MSGLSVSWFDKSVEGVDHSAFYLKVCIFVDFFVNDYCGLKPIVMLQKDFKHDFFALFLVQRFVLICSKHLH